MSVCLSVYLYVSVCVCVLCLWIQSDDHQETMPLSSFYVRKRPARQLLLSPPHYMSKTASPGLVCIISDGSRFSGVPVCDLKVKEADLYSAFIEIPYTQGAQVRITQCYLQTTLYLPLPRKHSPDGASQTEVADI